MKINPKHERRCVYCGCTDSKACVGGCSWVQIHEHTHTGVCSQCIPRLVTTLMDLTKRLHTPLHELIQDNAYRN
ncbi:MAG: hypothetical protein MUE94_03680 [Verrucomicrobia bacterium]|jgi:hypothetical protein|nr:hypothetical protein [Verrucomicrobiota bacterium]